MGVCVCEVKREVNGELTKIPPPEQLHAQTDNPKTDPVMPPAVSIKWHNKNQRAFEGLTSGAMLKTACQLLNKDMQRLITNHTTMAKGKKCMLSVQKLR